MTPAQQGADGAEVTSFEPPAGREQQAPQTRSVRDWGSLTETLTRELEERIRAAGGDPEQFQNTWNELVEAYGPRGAHDIVRLRAPEVLGVALDPELGEKLAHLALSRENFLPQSATRTPMSGLPHPGEEYRAGGGFEMPPQVRLRVEACTSALRRELARCYENPVIAEARLHVIASAERDPEAISAAVRHEPARLGALRPNGGDVAPIGAHAHAAYAFHLSPTADHALDLMSRESLQALQRAAASVERASAALDRAVDLHGPSLRAHLEGLRSEIVSRAAPAQDQAVRHAGRPDLESAPARLSDPEPLPPPPPLLDSAPGRGDAEPSPVDPAVEEASRAHDVLEEARLLHDRGATLRAERGSVQSILAVLDFDDHELLRTRRDVDALAAKVYRHSDRAVERWNKLVDDLGGDTERAQRIVSANPGRLGALHSEPAGWLARLPLPGWVADSIPFRSTAEAREHVPRMVEKAGDYSKARERAEAPVDWTPPNGQQLHSRAEVRAAARELDKRLGTEIDRNDAALLARGNLAGAERQAQRTISSLRPDQHAALARKLAAARGVPAAEMSAALSRLAAAPRLAGQAARAIRTAGEGSAPSL